MRRLLVIGASSLQVPAIIKAKELGLCVAVADYNPNAVGIQYADEYYDASTVDPDAIYHAAKKFRANGIMTLATDMPMRSLAYACERLGLPGLSWDSALKATDKGEMIRAFKAAEVNCPGFFIINSQDELVDARNDFVYPLIIKPTDNSGSRGVILVERPEELEKAFAYSSENGRSGAVIVEEYMVGPEVSVEIIVLEGVPHVLQVTDKLTTGAPHFVEMGHSQPSSLNAGVLEEVRNLASKAALAIGIQNGPAHAEIIVTADGPKMVEIGARLGGDCITTHLVPLSTGIDMVEATIRIALGEKPNIPAALTHGSAIRYLDTAPGVVESISGIKDALSVPGVSDVKVNVCIGDVVGDMTSSLSRTGYVIAQAADPKCALAACEEAISRINIDVRADISE